MHVKSRGVSTGAVLGQGVHARCCARGVADNCGGSAVAVICGEEQFVNKVIDVPVAGGRLQGLSFEDGVQQRFVEQS